MKVLYFHQHFGTPSGSIGTRSYEFARALVARGHSVTMVCGTYQHSGLNLAFDSRNSSARGCVDGIDVIALAIPYSNKDGLLRRALLFIKFALRSTRFAMLDDYDVLFATSTPLTAGIPGILMKLAGRSKPFIFEVRDLWPELPRALGMKNPVALGAMTVLEWLSYRSADGCIGLSPGIVEGIQRRSRVDQRIKMIPNGCDLELFHPAKRAPIDIPGVSASDFIAGFTGAHGKANGLDAVLDVAGELKRRGRMDIKLVLIGDGNRKPHLLERSKREALSNVIFLPPAKKTEIAVVTASFDCGLMTLENVPAFYFGTSPNKFFDYISAGVPVVNNYPGWLATLISENQCGIVVPPGDPTRFADALIMLADQPDYRAACGRNARFLAEREFARDKLALEFIEFLEQQGRIEK